ncbi:Uma2 family endonuclease [Dolichospermum circinale CS-537/01]|uniref:Uma2 family endonuclease n=1 Tax=Dolichospermum circinale CS-537/01 TaxID=3021739 RepID=A0ABT5A0T2_9CYAN|nr:Uma2 family endonuclease [Dolichospermum circinale]MDB9485510.1 Uma2 family endonuclease [Dolichospermum circinale CS-537/01]
MITQISEIKSPTELVISWEALPDDFQLEDEPVENTGQPLLAGALRESLEIAGFIQPQMLIASNFGLCATLDGKFIAKAPDWLYIPAVKEILPERKSYTPNLEGDIPAIVIEFLSDQEGGEYSFKRTYPPGKWFFYEQILQVPIYVIFDPDGGLLELYQLENGRYELKQPDENGLHWIDAMGLFLGTWRGEKEARTGYWLRWWNEAGNLLPWSVEKITEERQRAEQERQRAEQECQRAEQERQRAEQERQEKERLIAYLKSQGIDPSNLP